MDDYRSADKMSEMELRRLVKELRQQLANIEEAGWRSCIDHIIKPDSPCPVCGLEKMFDRGFMAAVDAYAPDETTIGELSAALAQAKQERAPRECGCPKGAEEKCVDILCPRK